MNRYLQNNPKIRLLETFPGLTPSEVDKSRTRHGENRITKKRRRGFFRQFLDSFGDPIIKILLIALAINTIFLFRRFDWYESAGIAVAILLATLVSTLSEYGSEEAFEKLQADAERIYCRVRRQGGVTQIPIASVVVGDIILLQPGDRVPADGCIVEGEADVDQASLNGESKEAHKIAASGHFEPTSDFLHPSALFGGTVILSGECSMRVTAVGDHTILGRLAREVQEETRESPLKVRLARLAGSISKLGYMGAAAVTLAYLFHALVIANRFEPMAIQATLHNPMDIFTIVMHAVTLAVSVIVMAVPEGLPMMITVVLSSNMRRMLRDQVLVRKLVGIETSGSINILFTDKTGTLTKGKLQVQAFVSGDNRMYESARAMQSHRSLWNLVHTSILYNNAAMLDKDGTAIGGNATDRALLTYLSGQPGDQRRIERIGGVPFSSARKFSSARLGGDVRMTLVKGAAEKILPACTCYYDENGSVLPLFGIGALQNRMSQMSGQAMRLIALATSREPVGEDGAFRNLTLVGILAVRDEIREDVSAAVNEMKAARVQVVMITGDHRDTALAIARECGICAAEGDVVLTSGELANMTDEEIAKLLPRLRVVARALPSDKSRLVKIAQAAGLVVGMTGDGVNDAPALKMADVGFAMGSGTEVAKEAGDIVILNDHFSAITRAILYGRTIFKSIRRFLIFQLTVNICAVGVSMVGPFLGVDAPVTVLQMLWINMVMDTLAGLAFGGEAPMKEYMREAPKKRDEAILNRYMTGEIMVTGLFTIGVCLWFLKSGFVRGFFRESAGDGVLLTGFFALFMFAAIFNSLNARTTRRNLFHGMGKNPAFMLVMGLVALVSVAMVYFGGTVLRTTGLTARELGFVIALAASVIPFEAIRRSVAKRFMGLSGV